MIEPRDRAERDTFELWKRLHPDSAYIAGVDESAGMFFVPTEAKVREAIARLDIIARGTKDSRTRKFLRAMKARLELAEPCRMPESMVGSLFGLMIKEGVRPAHVVPILTAGARALDAERRRLGRKRWPTGQRALTQLAASSLEGILGVVAQQLPGEEGRHAIDAARKALRRYRDAFALDGFRPAGSFEETFGFYRKNGCDLGRQRTYARALRDLWDYSESPAGIERAGLRMLRAEMPRFRSFVAAWAHELGVEPTAETLGRALKDAKGLPPHEVLPFLNSVRGPMQAVANKHIVRINPNYDVLVVETPSYLADTTPSGAAFELDGLTDHSKEIFLATTDERSAARPTAGELVNLLVHEEYGHCVHGSNSAHAFAAKPGLLDIVNSPFECVSEGIAFQRELEFLPLTREIADGKVDGLEERAFSDAMAAWGGLRDVAREYEFTTLLWRIVRFLRVVGDARINSGKQNLVDFVDWAHGTTGLDRATVYYQVFPAHQILGPGYATTYAIIGERIRKLQGEALRKGASLRDFNAYASSFGWPPKTFFEASLAHWVQAFKR
jgi:hypothetical protein